ncbi:MAG: hypothetical protein LBN22_00610 [Clostridiales Family XIII bacterium]|nr:hypothetical protein [Clostridiales Family XIII bacterium]
MNWRAKKGLLKEQVETVAFNPNSHRIYIGDVLAERSERTNADAELLSVTMNDGVVKRSAIEGKDNSSEDKSNYKYVHTGDVVYNSMRMWQGANGVSAFDGIVSPAYTVLFSKSELDIDWIGLLFKTGHMISEFRKNSQGLTSDTWNLKYPQIATIRFSLPGLPEQTKAVRLITKLSQHINVAEMGLNKLLLYKQGLLQQMFV